MSLRRFGILILVLSGVLPLLVAGMIAIPRAEHTALEDVRIGNGRLAVRAASRIAAHVDSQVLLLKSLGSILTSRVLLEPTQVDSVLRNFRMAFRHIESLEVVSLADCHAIASSTIEDRNRETTRYRCDDPDIRAARDGRLVLGEPKLAQDFKLLMKMVIPLEVAGERVGIAVAQLDLVGIWDAVGEVRVGETGTARLLARDGTLLAHGDPEERRRVFLREIDPRAAVVARHGLSGARYQDGQGREVLAVAAKVPQVDWLLVVEQPISEGYHAALVLKRDLFVVMALAMVLAVVVGVLLGRAPVRAIDALKRHAQEVARGNLGSRVELPRFVEMRSLAQAFNKMAVDLGELQEDIRAKERLSTFARVAAGLAHDLQAPIESIRDACAEALSSSGASGSPPVDDSPLAPLQKAAQSHLPRLHRYVRDLRRLAHDGELPLELADVDPRKVAEKVVAESQGSARWQGVELAVEGSSAPILVDESLLHRALSNLVANGADACMTRRPPGGRVVISISETARGEEVALRVIDTGVGMEEHFVRELMAHDFRSTKRSTGVGIGLCVVRQIAAAHGGQVLVESRLGHGSTFTLLLPRHPSKPAPSAQETAGR